MINIIRLFFVAVFGMFLISCQDVYVPTTQDLAQEYVVEGYVEAGKTNTPTFVMVTKSIPFLSEVAPSKFAELFVKDAVVTVKDGTKEVPLVRLCVDDLSPELKRQAYELLGLNPDSSTVNVCVYVDVLNQIDRKIGGKYDLTVKVGDKVMTATTTIPKFVGIYDFQFKPTPGIPIDTLAQMFCTIDDPAATIEHYRYFTATGGESFLAPFQSVTNDILFNGQKFEFPLSKAQRRGQGDFDPQTFGMYRRGDTISIKWCTIDKEHFDFWNTRDFNASNGGPFSSYTRIVTNIKGGLGIWGGYASDTYDMVVPK
jgi:hypothetical protein